MAFRSPVCSPAPPPPRRSPTFRRPLLRTVLPAAPCPPESRTHVKQTLNLLLERSPSASSTAFPKMSPRLQPSPAEFVPASSCLPSVAVAVRASDTTPRTGRPASSVATLPVIKDTTRPMEWSSRTAREPLCLRFGGRECLDIASPSLGFDSSFDDATHSASWRHRDLPRERVEQRLERTRGYKWLRAHKTSNSPTGSNFSHRKQKAAFRGLSCAGRDVLGDTLMDEQKRSSRGISPCVQEQPLSSEGVHLEWSRTLESLPKLEREDCERAFAYAGGSSSGRLSASEELRECLYELGFRGANAAERHAIAASCLESPEADLAELVGKAAAGVRGRLQELRKSDHREMFASRLSRGELHRLRCEDCLSAAEAWIGLRVDQACSSRALSEAKEVLASQALEDARMAVAGANADLIHFDDEEEAFGEELRVFGSHRTVNSQARLSRRFSRLGSGKCSASDCSTVGIAARAAEAAAFAAADRDGLVFGQFRVFAGRLSELTLRARARTEREIQEEYGIVPSLFACFRQQLVDMHTLFGQHCHKEKPNDDVSESDESENEEGDQEPVRRVPTQVVLGAALMDFECLHCLKLLGLVPKTPRISKEIRERVDEIGVTGIRFSGFLEVAKWCKDKVAQLKNDVLFKVFNRLDMITANNVQLAAQRQGGDKRLTLAGLSEFLLRVVGEQDIKEAVDKEHLCLNARDEGSPMQIVLANIIKDAKLDGQERFSFAEVRAYCQEVYEQLRKLHIQDEMIKAQDYKFEVHEILELHNSFDKMDRDCSGTLDLQEVKRAIHVMKKEKFVAGPSALQIAFRQLDEDRSGALDFVEYMHLVQMVRDGEGVFAEGNVVVTNILDLPVELLLDLLHSIGIGTRIADLYEDRDRDRLRAEAARRLGVDVEELLFDALGVATMRDLLGVAKMRSQST